MNKRSTKKKSNTDWARVDALVDTDIDYSEIPEQNQDFFKNASLRMPDVKAVVTLRMDKDVLKWFKKQGRGYQTRINALLRAYMEAQQQLPKRP